MALYQLPLTTCMGKWRSYLILFLVHLSRRLKCTIVIMRCLSSVCPLSVHPSLTFHIFDFSSITTEQNSTKLIRKQEVNILYQVCVFWVDPKNKMAALASDWLRHFRLLLWNHRTEFNETWQEARSQCPLPSLCFLGRSEKQDGCPSLWLAETFSTSLMKPLNGIQQTWQEARSQCPLPSLCFSGRSEKQDGRPGRFLKKVAHCTQVHDMLPFGPLVLCPWSPRGGGGVNISQDLSNSVKLIWGAGKKT